MPLPQGIIMIILSVIGFAIQCLFVYVENKKEYVKAVILKGSASLCFTTIGIIAFINSSSKDVTLFVLIGLILGLVGDVLLNVRFIVKKHSNVPFIIGTLSFLCGHIFYIVCLFKIASSKALYIPFILAVVLTVIVALFIFLKLKVGVGKKIFGTVYVFVVSLFCSVALFNLIVQQNTFNYLCGIGSILFFLSDIILIFNSFGPNPKLYLRASNLLLYYVGQILIGFALLF